MIPGRSGWGALAVMIASWTVSVMAGCRDGEGGASSADARPARPNVILIVVDTLRADHLSHYGYARDTSLPLDGLRARSTLFTRALATAPWTGPSTMSIHTGLSPLQHRSNDHGDVLADEATTLAEILSQAGYATHGISFNQEVTRKMGYAQGFDVFDDFLGDAIDYPDIQVMARRVERWLATEPREPYFLYLQPMSVHGPYRVPKSRQSTLLGRAPSRAFEYYGRELMSPLMRKGKLKVRAMVTPEIFESLVDQYDVAVRYSMEEIARMLAAIEQAGRMDNTIVILTADHGEELFDHGGFSHGFTLHREVLHVPLYVSLPDQTSPATDDRAVSILDIMPTVLARADLPEPEGLNGIDLFAAPTPASAERLFVQVAGWTERAVGLSLIRGVDHLIDLEHGYDSPVPRLSLFDLERDPRERTDRAQAESEEAAALKRILREEADRLAKDTVLPEPRNVLDELEKDEAARLKALGYAE